MLAFDVLYEHRLVALRLNLLDVGVIQQVFDAPEVEVVCELCCHQLLELVFLLSEVLVHEPRDVL